MAVAADAQAPPTDAVVAAVAGARAAAATAQGLDSRGLAAALEDPERLSSRSVAGIGLIAVGVLIVELGASR